MRCSVIVSRAIPEIDGFKPSHRKLLYTMYQDGPADRQRGRSRANIVGQTMKLNPHGDAAIYDTMVRLARGNEALLHPFVDSQGQLRQGLFPRYGLRRLPVHRGASSTPICAGAVPRHRRGHRRLCRQLRRHHAGADAAAHHVPERAGLRQHGHRRRHGLATSARFNLREVCQTAIALIKDPGRRPAGHAARAGFPHRRRDSLRPRRDGGRSTAPAAAPSSVRARWRYRQGGQSHRNL